MTITRHQLAAASGALLLFAPVAVAQRNPGPAVSVSAGFTEYDLSGVGNAPIAGARIAFGLGRILVLEPTVMYFRYDARLGGEGTFLFPELTVQAQAHLGGVRPYIGAGWGVYTTLQGPFHVDWTMHAATGFRFDVAEAWGLRVEGRLRSLGPLGGNVSDVSFGVSRALR